MAASRTVLIPVAAAIHAVARREGILLHPVYAAKAMAGLIDRTTKGLIAKDETVVFLHSGGTPALFAYAEELGVAVGSIGIE